MSDFLNRLAQDLELERETRATKECLSDAMLEQLADGSLPAAAARSASHHLGSCLPCLQAYGSLRSLLAVLDSPENSGHVSARTHAKWQLIPAWLAKVCDLFAWRIPAGALVFVAAACILVTWVTATRLDRIASTGPLFPFSPITKLSDPVANGRRLTVTGIVARVQDVSFEGVPAHIVRLRDHAATEYIVFAWGAPTIMPGQSVEIEGLFQRTSEPPKAPTYRGIALRFQVPATH